MIVYKIIRHRLDNSYRIIIYHFVWIINEIKKRNIIHEILEKMMLVTLTQCMPVVGGARSSYTPIRVAAVAGWFPLRVREEVEAARVGPGDLDDGNAEMASAAQPTCRPWPSSFSQSSLLFYLPFFSQLSIFTHPLNPISQFTLFHTLLYFYCSSLLSVSIHCLL